MLTKETIAYVAILITAIYATCVGSVELFITCLALNELGNEIKKQNS